MPLHATQPENVPNGPSQANDTATPWGRLVGLAFFFSVLGAIKLIWSNKLAIFDPASFITVTMMTLGLTLLAFGPTRLKAAISAIGSNAVSADAAANTKNVFKMAATFSFVSGGMMTLVGLIIMLQNMADPTQLGPSMAAALIAFLYGVIQGVLCLAISKIVRPVTE